MKTLHRTSMLVRGAAVLGVLALWVPIYATGRADAAIPDVGVIRLHLGPDADYTRFDTADLDGEGYTAGTANPITVSGCDATVTGGPLAITPIPSPKGTLGLVADGLGVKVKGEGNGLPCGRVDSPSQALSLSLTGTLANEVIDFAELDIEGKFGAQVVAQMWLDSDLVATESLPTGPGSDSGPDSADGDNYRWRIPDPEGPGRLFDKIVLSVPSPTGGAFSLEGGADGTVPEALGVELGTNDSLLHVATGAQLDCGDTTSRTGTGVPDVSLTRLENAEGTASQCEPIPYLLRTSTENDDQIVFLAKDLLDQTTLTPQFSMTIVWESEAAEYPVIKTTQIDYFDGQGLRDLEWCGGSTAAPTLPAGHPWCLVAQDIDLDSGDQIKVAEQLYGAGDPKGLR